MHYGHGRRATNAMCHRHGEAHRPDRERKKPAARRQALHLIAVRGPFGAFSRHLRYMTYGAAFVNLPTVLAGPAPPLAECPFGTAFRDLSSGARRRSSSRPRSISLEYRGFFRLPCSIARVGGHPPQRHRRGDRGCAWRHLAMVGRFHPFAAEPPCPQLQPDTRPSGAMPEASDGGKDHCRSEVCLLGEDAHCPAPRQIVGQRLPYCFSQRSAGSGRLSPKPCRLAERRGGNQEAP